MWRLRRRRLGLSRYFNTRKIHPDPSDNVIYPTYITIYDDTKVLSIDKKNSTKSRSKSNLTVANEFNSLCLPENTEIGIPIIEANVVHQPSLCERFRNYFKSTRRLSPLNRAIPSKYKSSSSKKSRKKSSKK
jgi:hypothetical protein